MIEKVITIPSQLQDRRFLLVKRKSKIPREAKWQTEKNYAFDDPKLLTYINNGGNYGVLCEEHKICIDADISILYELIEVNFPETFTVQSGGGGRHFYYNLVDASFDRNLELMAHKKNIGHIKTKGGFVVGPGSIHGRTKNDYCIINNIPIAQITKAEIEKVLASFLGKKKRLWPCIDDLIDQMIINKRHYDHNTNLPIVTDLLAKGYNEQVIHTLFSYSTAEGHEYNWRKTQTQIDSVDINKHAKCETIQTLGHCLEEKCSIYHQQEQPPEQKESFIDEEHPLDPYMEKDINGNRRFSPTLLAKKICEDSFIKTLRDTNEILIYNESEGIYIPGETVLREEIQALTKGSLTKHYVDETLYQIQVMTYIDREEISQDPFLLHLENGIFNLKTYQLMPFDSEIITTIKLPVIYNSAAKCSKILQFLSEVLYPEDIPVIQEVIGYCLYKDYSIQKAVMFMGEGSNGKSVLLSVIETLLGVKNVSAVSLQDLLRDRFAVACLFGKLANIYADISDKGLMQTGIFKILTGGDLIRGQHKFRNAFFFVNYAKLLFSCNKLPEAYDDTDAFFRRWIFINFPNTFTGDNMNPHLTQELTTSKELSGLFTWAIEGLKRVLQKGKFSNDVSTAQLKEHYIRMSDALEAFIMDCISEDSEGVIGKSEFYNVYCEYCRAHKIPAKGKETIGKNITKTVRVETYRPRKGEGKRPTSWKGITFKKNYKNHLVNAVKVVNDFSYFKGIEKNQKDDPVKTLDIIIQPTSEVIQNPSESELLGSLIPPVQIPQVTILEDKSQLPKTSFTKQQAKLQAHQEGIANIDEFVKFFHLLDKKVTHSIPFPHQEIVNNARRKGFIKKYKEDGLTPQQIQELIPFLSINNIQQFIIDGVNEGDIYPKTPRGYAIL